MSPDASGSKGTSTVELAAGDYTVEFVSPVNKDGSAYEVYDTGKPQDVTVNTDADAEAPAVDCPMTQIPADQVTDEMLKDIIDKTQQAVDKGDETLKGDAGKDILEKLDQNVSANPNASDETKGDAADAKDSADVDSKPADTVTPTTKPSDNGSSSGSGSNSGSGSDNSGSKPSSGSSGGSSSSKPAETKPAHSHTWADHTATRQVWVSNIVTVDDYETQKVAVGEAIVFAYDGYTTMSDADAGAHSVWLIEQGLPDNYRYETIYETKQVKVGSHTEDHGSYQTESYVDYRYCTGCGARQ